MSLREEQCNKVCRILDDVLANRPTERDSLIVAVRKAFDAMQIAEPHGRLIDADEPMTKISTMMQEPDYQHEGENWMVGLIMARDAIDDAPTVIEAEGSET